MRSRLAWILTIAIAAGASSSLAQPSSDDQRALRERIEQRYDVLPLSNGLALRPRTPVRDVRLIEVADGAVVVNGVPVTGRELRERIGASADADAILKLSFMTAEQQRALFVPPTPAPSVEAPRDTQPLERPDPSRTDSTRRIRRATGDRVRVFGDVKVEQDEEITGQVVAVFGSVRIDGEVGDQVVSVFGTVDLGPSAVVGGDVVSVGGRVRRAPGAQTRQGVTEVSLTDPDFRIHMGPWFDGWGPFFWVGSFGAVPRLIGSGFRMLLLILLTGIALVVARRSVEASAQRVSDSPVQATLVGLVAEILIGPVLLLSVIVLAISLIGIPLLMLLPFVVLLLVLMALVGFTGTAAAIGRAVQRRFGLGETAPFMSVVLGVLVILSPLLAGRLLALAGWPATPIALLLVGAGFAVELLAWASGFGAVLTNAFTRWQAKRSAKVSVAAPPAVS